MTDIRRSAYKQRCPDVLTPEECVEILRTSDGKGAEFKMIVLCKLLSLPDVDREKIIQSIQGEDNV